MQKKLIALAVASVLAAPLAAQAGVEVYGQARMSVDYNNNKDVTGGACAADAHADASTSAEHAAAAATACDKSALSVSSNKSRIGFRGDEDLGNGLKALWQIEQDVKFDSGTWGYEARDTFLGLGSNFGTVLAGKLSTPYRTATERLDVFKDTKADYNAIVGSIGTGGQLTGDTNVGNLRTNNTLAYVTPSMSGFQGTLAYVTNYNDLLGGTGTGDKLPRTKADGKQDAFSLSGTYDNGPLYLAAAYEVLNKADLGGGATPDNTTSMKIGGGFNLGQGTTLGALFENMDLGGTTGDRNAWYLSGMHKMAAFNVKAAYGSADKWSGAGLSKTGAQQFSLGAGYDLSKTTEAYALYTQVSNDTAGTYGLESIKGYADKTVSSFSLGIKHAFSSK